MRECGVSISSVSLPWLHGSAHCNVVLLQGKAGALRNALSVLTLQGYFLSLSLSVKLITHFYKESSRMPKGILLLLRTAYFIRSLPAHGPRKAVSHT